MKKPTTSPETLAQALRHVASDLLAALKQRGDDDEALRWAFGDDSATWSDDFFSTSPPERAPTQGRGERATLLVGWIWPGDAVAQRSAASTVCAQIARIVGVESVSAPELDPQFGLVWSTRVTVRWSQ